MMMLFEIKQNQLEKNMQCLLYIKRAGWVAAIWADEQFCDHHDYYPLDDVDCMFELPTGKLCTKCSIPMAVCKLSEPVTLRCLSCGQYG